MKFIIPGTLTRRRKGMHPRIDRVDLYIDGEDRADALFQAHHGVIEMGVQKSYPGASIRYDLRKMKLHSR